MVKSSKRRRKCNQQDIKLEKKNKASFTHLRLAFQDIRVADGNWEQ